MEPECEKPEKPEKYSGCICPGQCGWDMCGASTNGICGGERHKSGMANAEKLCRGCWRAKNPKAERPQCICTGDCGSRMCGANAHGVCGRERRDTGIANQEKLCHACWTAKGCTDMSQQCYCEGCIYEWCDKPCPNPCRKTVAQTYVKPLCNGCWLAQGKPILEFRCSCTGCSACHCERHAAFHNNGGLCRGCMEEWLGHHSIDNCNYQDRTISSAIFIT